MAMDHSRGVLDWPWESVMDAIRHYGKEIGTLAQRGDALARKVRTAYEYAYDHPADLQANTRLREAFNEYLQRDLMTNERNDLSSRFGHQIVEPGQEQPRIVVPMNYRHH